MATGPLIAIVGETASGKSAMAMELARRYDGEIICADSRTVYRGMDIGTAKPSQADQEEIPHHVLDVVTPEQSFNAARFKELAEQAIDDITVRGKLPIMVGGTGLYIDSVLFDYQFRSVADPSARARYTKMTVQELQQEITDKGLELPNNPQNPRHLVRVLETGGEVSKHQNLRENTLVLGIEIDRETLKERIEKRIDVMIATGFIEELQKLREQYSDEPEAFRAPGYRAFLPYLRDEIDLETAKAAFVQNDLRLAKQQRTWFKRNPKIQWVGDIEHANMLVKKFLDKFAQ